MNAEELKYMKALQPFFDEKMGPQQVGDWVILKRDFPIIPEIITNVFASMSPFDTNMRARCNPAHYYRLPLPIDPHNPERGLWGMVDWMGLFVNIDHDGMINIFSGFDNGESITDGWQTPTLALLKALAAQEGVTL